MSLMDQVVYAPRPGKGQRFAVTTTGDRTALVSTIAKSGWIRVIARGANIQFTCGSVTDTIPVYDSTTQSEIGYPVLNGTYHDFWLKGTETHILWDADGAGFVDIHRVGQERVKTET